MNARDVLGVIAEEQELARENHAYQTLAVNARVRYNQGEGR